MKNNGADTFSTTPSQFYAIGLNYKKADERVRGYFSISETAQRQLLEDAKKEGIRSLIVISTCNRTELYGFAKSSSQLIQLLCSHTHGTVEDFEKVAYVRKNEEAVSHMFQVGTGLDSQILGDFEIISQLRNSFKRSKSLGLLNAYMERLANAVIQASKRIKNETDISSGATSVSFAAVQYIMARVPYVSEKNIVLFGLGKIGRNTCENLLKHTKNDHISLINRTKVKAEELAVKYNVVVKDYADIQTEIAQADVLIVATGAPHPTINKELLFLKKPILILDLSIPRNVDQNVAENPLVSLVSLDELSKVTHDTLAQREAQVPRAEEIIDEVKTEFLTWVKNRSFAPTIKALKSKLGEIKAGEIDNQRRKRSDFNEQQAEILSDRLIHKITTQFANHLKDDSVATSESIAFIQRVFQIDAETYE
tara:strand:- start:1120 stop:2391 length:1272 start_codon:yes stop_codon:yes gene_type:complete